MTPKTTFSRTLTFVRRIAAVAALVTTLILPAHAQTPGNIEVTVKTRTGDAVKGATITVKNDVTFQLFPATTDAEGKAIIPNLPPGLYSVKANAPGFDEMSQTNVRVEANKRTSIKFTAEPAFGAAPTGDVQTEVIDTLQELSSLPNLNNDLTPLLQIVPGAVATGSASLGRVIVDGRGIDQQTARLDGVDFTSLVDFPSADAAINPVSSFQKPEVAGDLDRAATRSGAAGYEPRYGPGTGSVSETSTFRGSRDNLVFQIFSDLRNNALNARNFFDYDGDNALRRTRFGGKVGHVLDDK